MWRDQFDWVYREMDPLRHCRAAEPDAVVDIRGYSIPEADCAEAVKELLATHQFLARGGTHEISQVMA